MNKIGKTRQGQRPRVAVKKYFVFPAGLQSLAPSLAPIKSNNATGIEVAAEGGCEAPEARQTP